MVGYDVMSTLNRPLFVTWATRQRSASPGVSPWQNLPVSPLEDKSFSKA